MFEEKFYEIFSNVLSYPKEKINLETKIEDVESWDSVQHLNLILTLEEEFGIKFRPEEIQEMLSVKSILNKLKEKIK